MKSQRKCNLKKKKSQKNEISKKMRSQKNECKKFSELKNFTTQSMPEPDNGSI